MRETSEEIADRLTLQQRCLILGALAAGRGPDRPIDTASSHKVLIGALRIAASLGFASGGTDQYGLGPLDGMREPDPEVASWYRVLIEMTVAAPLSEPALLEGAGNLHGPIPANPPFTAVRLSTRGWDVAFVLLARAAQ